MMAQSQATESRSPEALGSLTARESELLKRAGERVFALSRRLAERDRQVEKLTAEAAALRELLSENRNIREILSAQITSLQTEHEREYEERAELRRLVAGLHVQLQEVLPLLMRQLPTPDVASLPEVAEQHRPAERLTRPPRRESWTKRLFANAEREVRELSGGSRKRR